MSLTLTRTAPSSAAPADLAPTTPGTWALSGRWTALDLGSLPQRLDKLVSAGGAVVLDGSRLVALDSAGAWVLQRWLARGGTQPSLVNWPARSQQLMTLLAERSDVALPQARRPGPLAGLGQTVVDALAQGLAFLAFVGQVALAGLGLLTHPSRLRWRTVMRNVQISGAQALPITGLTAFLLGVVVAYQGADQLRHYGANIFVVDLVGYAMLREFAPLITAIIIAGRSGSAYAAQIGTMVVTEEVDAMRTMAIDPIELLVLPKLLALALALPLLTVFADMAGVFGGMVMARSGLDIGFHEFLDRFGREMQGATFLIGIGKSVVFSFVIALIGCFQGFRTQGSADSVGRQTTVSVVQAIFLLIVIDALFSIAFNILDI